MATITLNLPESTMQQANQAAALLHRPVEELLTEMLAAILPMTHDAPDSMQAELTRMTWLDDRSLWKITQGSMSNADEASLRQLSVIQSERSLKKKEQQQLTTLRQEYGRVTLLKARAYALLSLRGGKPLLNQN